MLPPVQSDATTTPCQSSQGNKILTFDGASAIRCNRNVTIDSSARLGIGTDTPNAKADVAGGVKFGNDASICTAANAGTIRWNGVGLQFCDSSNWKDIGMPNMTCPDGQVLRSITDGLPECFPSFTNCAAIYQESSRTPQTVNCPAGKRLLAGYCWRRNTGYNGGEYQGHVQTETSFSCEVVNGVGQRIWAVCCDYGQ